MNIIVTLDYELFLGDVTGTIENCLIKPMSDLCNISEKYGFNYVIFADAAYILRLKQLKAKDSFIKECYEKVTSNLKMLSEKGNDIELHFHPQWLYSTWNSETKMWTMDREHYKLSDMPIEDVRKYLPQANQLLERIIQKKIIAYRAGGFCMEPFLPLEKIFDNMGIYVDSSVARCSVVKSPIHNYDYSNIPQDIVYCFNHNICKKEENGKRIEVSISSRKWSSLSYIVFIRKILLKYNPRYTYKDGESIIDKPNRGRFISILSKLFNPYIALASIDTASSALIPYIFKDAQKRGDDTFVVIGHPKNTTDASLRNFEHFIQMNREHLNFITINDLIRDHKY